MATALSNAASSLSRGARLASPRHLEVAAILASSPDLWRGGNFAANNHGRHVVQGRYYLAPSKTSFKVPRPDPRRRVRRPPSSPSQSQSSPPTPRQKPSAAPTTTTTVTLRKLTSPFLLLCHPDRTPLVGSALDPSSTSARETNLRAVQTLNGLIDAAEAIYDRAAYPSGKAATARGGGRIDLPARTEVEFLIPPPDDGGPRGGIRKPKAKDFKSTTLARRSVVLSFPPEMLQRARAVEKRTGRYDVRAAREVRLRMASELVRLCRAAGCGTPDGYREWLVQNGEDGEVKGGSKGKSAGGREFGLADLLAEELDLDGSRRSKFDSSSPRFSSLERPRNIPMTEYEKSRKRFMDSVDWVALRKNYERAQDDMIADMSTRHIAQNNEELRAGLISGILGRIRVDAGELHETADSSTKDAVVGDSEGRNRRETEARGGANGDSRLHDDKASAAKPPSPAVLESLGLGPVGQLIAIRRLSLLFEDNFDALHMEELGRMWENLTIVLTPQRNVPDDALASQRAVPRPRRKKGTVRESGFKFMYGGEDVASVTAYVPVDFTDEEILVEFRRNLGEYWANQSLIPGGLEDLIQRYMMK